MVACSVGLPRRDINERRVGLVTVVIYCEEQTLLLRFIVNLLYSL